MIVVQIRFRALALLPVVVDQVAGLWRCRRRDATVEEEDRVLDAARLDDELTSGFAGADLCGGRGAADRGILGRHAHGARCRADRHGGVECAHAGVGVVGGCGDEGGE